MSRDPRSPLTVLAGVVCSVGLAWPGPAHGEAPTPVFRSSISVSAGVLPYAVVVADFDRDGKLDLGLANAGPANVTIDGGIPQSNDVRIALGHGDGTFAEGFTCVSGGSPSHLVAGDFDEDGDPDVAVARWEGSLAVALVGAGGACGPATSYSIAGEPWQIAAGDIDGDGHLDLAVAAWLGSEDDALSEVSLFYGRGDGRFDASPVITGLTRTQSLAVGDLSGDGRADLVVLTTNNAWPVPPAEQHTELQVFLSQAGRTLAAPAVYSGRLGSYEAALADVTGDGRTDVVVTGREPSYLQFYWGNITVFAGTGGGTLAKVQDMLVGHNAYEIAIADFDRDGAMDYAVTEPEWFSISVHRGAPDGSVVSRQIYAPTVDAFTDIAAGDFNGDGRPDLVAAAFAGNRGGPTASVLLQRPDGTFQAPRLLYSWGPEEAVGGDFNGDGIVDLFVAGHDLQRDRTPSRADVMLGDGAGGLREPDGRLGVPPVSPPVSPEGYHVAAADFDGDGKTDGAVADRNLVTLTGGYQPASPQLTPVITRTSPLTGCTAGEITTADIDRDGRVDLVAACAEGVAVSRGKGDLTLAAPTVYTLPSAVTNVEVADVNGDGLPDVAALAATSGVLFVLPGDAGGGLAPPWTLSLPRLATWLYDLAAADIDGDGLADLLVALDPTQEGVEGPVLTFLGRRAASPVPGPPIPLGASYPRFAVDIATGDVDRDGRMDVLIHDSVGAGRLHLGNGDGTFRAPLVLEGLASAGRQVIADANRDGRPDILFVDQWWAGIMLNDTVLSGHANLSVSVAESADPVPAGGTLAYTITVRNQGPEAAPTVEAAGVLQPPLALTGTTGDCTGSLPCALGTIPAGGSRTFIASYAVPAGATGVLVASVTAGTSAWDDDPTDNRAVARTAVDAAASDLVVRMSGPVGAVRGQLLDYRIAVTNNGPSDAPLAQVLDPTPADMQFVANAGDCGVAFPCPLGTIPEGATREVRARFRIPPGYAGPDPVINAASVASSALDPVAANDEASQATSIQPGSPALVFHTVTPCRLLDTRYATGLHGGPALSAQAAREFPAVGSCDVPAGAVALSANLTATGATAPGHVRLYPAGEAPTLSSSLNFLAGQTRANNAIVPLSAAGAFAVFDGQAAGNVHFVLDVNGYFE
jgi:uncharacterized repeat protein (TIGR01451 family)